MAEVIFERFVPSEGRDSCEQLDFDLELEEGRERVDGEAFRVREGVRGGCGGEVMRGAAEGVRFRGGVEGVSVSSSTTEHEDSPPLPLEDRGMVIPRRYTMATACSLPSHLTSHLSSPPPRQPRCSYTPSSRLAVPCRLPSTSSLWSLRSRGTSPSPSRRRLPSILRSSLSRLFSGRPKSPPPLHSVSASPSQASFVSQQTEDIVRESLELGLPIIPFAVVNDPQKNNPSERLRANYQKSESEKVESEQVGDVTDSGYCDMELNKIEEKPVKSLVSQSSYVEMNPSEDSRSSKLSPPLKADVSALEDPYMDMHLANIFPASARKSSLFDPDPFSLDTKKHNPAMLRSFVEKTRLNLSSAEKSGSGKHKKGNRHKDDYAFLDLSKNSDISQGLHHMSL